MLASGIRLVSVEHSSIDQCINEMIFFVAHIVKVFNVLVTQFFEYEIHYLEIFFWEGLKWL